MSIPDFQTIMLPFLRLVADDAEHTLGSLIETLSDESQLTAAEREQKLPSGRQATISNRTTWAASHLRAAGLLERHGRGRYRITDRGHSVLAEQPSRVDMKLLSRYPEFRAYRGIEARAEPEAGGSPEQTPEEAFLAAYRTLRDATERELLSRAKQADPELFEQLVVDLLVAMGYGGSQEDAGRAVGRSGDGGIDGTALTPAVQRRPSRRRLRPYRRTGGVRTEVLVS